MMTGDKADNMVVDDKVLIDELPRSIESKKNQAESEKPGILKSAGSIFSNFFGLGKLAKSLGLGELYDKGGSMKGLAENLIQKANHADHSKIIKRKFPPATLMLFKQIAEGLGYKNISNDEITEFMSVVMGGPT